MNSVWLIVGLVLVSIFALSLALYPLRKFSIYTLILTPILIIFIGVSYWRWGAFSALQQHQRAQTMLQSMQNPAELIKALRLKLNDKAESARGWYLLGRLYASQNQWPQAVDAFELAHKWQPANELTTVNYAQSLWQFNHQHMNKRIRSLLIQVLKNNVNQPDALALLAMDAFKRHQYEHAIDYWQRLLMLAPPQSDAAQAIREAIAKAQGMLRH